MLKDGQFALMKTDPYTGVPLDAEGHWITNGRSKEYLCFDTEELARKYANEILKEDRLLEWSLINDAGIQIDVIHDKEALEEISRSRKHRTFLERIFRRKR